MKINEFLKTELTLLYSEFDKMFPKHGTTWQRMTVKELLIRLEDEYIELRNAVYSGSDEVIDEAIDCALVALLLAERANTMEEG